MHMLVTKTWSHSHGLTCYNGVLAFLNIYSTEPKMYAHRSLCISVLSVYSLQSQTGSNSDALQWGLNKLRSIHLTEYYRAAHKDGLLIYTKALCWVKKASLKRLCTIWFHWCDIFKWQNYRKGERVSGCLGGENGSGCGFKKAARGILVVMAVLCLHCDGRYTTHTGVKMTQD